MTNESASYKTALYMRVSKDDSLIGESESIDTQRKILKNFCTLSGFCIAGEYTDDGFSGTDFKKRPGFLRLIADIESKKINAVIAKDLSRLGRNSAETGFLLDTYFPQKKVRFISVTENIDTSRRDRTFNLITPVYNFTNELYCADISNKIRSALEIKMKNGEFIGSFAPFGYKKDETDKNRLVPDSTTCETVKKIFTLAKNGFSSYEIASKLNEQNIPTPSSYKKSYKRVSTAWSPSSVIKILNNEVYLGHTAQGKTKKPGFKSTRSYTVPKKDWIVIKNTHTPLVDLSVWNTAHNNMKTHKKTSSAGFANIFSGIAKCADCGKNMSSSFSGKNAYLVCGGYKLGGKCACSAHRIGYSLLCDCVLSILKKHITLSQNNKAQIIDEIIFEHSKYFSKQISDTEAQIKLLTSKTANLFDDKYSQTIAAPEFSMLLKKYSDEKRIAEKKYTALQKSKSEINSRLYRNLCQAYEKIMQFENLTPEILNSFVEKINIYNPARTDDGIYINFDIYLKFGAKTLPGKIQLFF